MTNSTKNRLRPLLITLVIITACILCDQFLAAQDSTEVAIALQCLQAKTTYQASPTPTSVRPPQQLLIREPGTKIKANCLEQSLLLCYMINLYHPEASLFILAYDNGPESLGHATALINGLEYDPTGGLQGHSYSRCYRYSYEQALSLYTRRP